MRSGDQSSLSRERPIRVLFVDHCGELSGAEIGLLQLLRGFSAIEPIVLLGARGPFASKLRQEGIRVEVEPLPDILRSYRRPLASGSFPKRSMPKLLVELTSYVWSIVRRIREIEPDIVHTNSAKAHVYGGLAARIARVPMICHLRELVAAETLGRLTSLGLRLVLHLVPGTIVANSHRTARSAGRLRQPVHVVPSPIDGALFERPSVAGARSHTRRIGIVGSLEPQKGQDVFLRAFADAFASSPSVRAVVCGGNLFGDEAYARGIRELTSRLGIADRVTFTGFVPDVERVFSSLDVLVSASVTPEGFGQSIFQALAAGVPVVASDNGGACDFLQDEESALLVAPRDSRALAIAMRRALEDTQLSAQLRRRGRLVARRFTPEAVQRQMLEVYEATLAEQPADVSRAASSASRSRDGATAATAERAGRPNDRELLRR